MTVDLDYVLMLSQRDTDIKEHILLLYFLPVVNKYKILVEIGAGQSTFALTAAVNITGGQLYSHDFLDWAILREFAEGKGVLDKEERYQFVAGDNLVTGKTWDKPIDFIFIDSSHTYEGTKAELELWGKWVVPGGMITMHDTRTEWSDCRKAMVEFLAEQGDQYKVTHLTNQNGFSILQKKGKYEL